MIPPLVRNAIVGKIQMMMTLTELITSWRLEKGITRLNLVYLLNFKRQSKYLFLYSGEVLGLDLQPTSKRLQDSEWDQLFRSQCRRFTRKTKMQAQIKSKSLRSRLAFKETLDIYFISMCFWKAYEYPFSGQPQSRKDIETLGRRIESTCWRSTYFRLKPDIRHGAFHRACFRFRSGSSRKPRNSW